jgi:mannose/fructose/N-acetylgalactosamine-specific phosphotransferase system component IID
MRERKLVEAEKKNIQQKITKWDLFKVFFASFFMQAVWNFRSLISIGFSICFLPIVGKLCKTPQAKREFFERHLKFFNAHPYFASFALGISIRIEEMRSKGELDSLPNVDRLKDLLIGPLGAVGDQLFWATIKPASLLFGMLGIILSPTVTIKIIVLVLTFLIYNIPHFYYRYEGIVEGYHHATDIYKYIGQQRFEIIIRWYSYVFAISLFSLIFIYSYQLSQENPLLILVLLIAALYTYLLNRFSTNFYLVTFASFIFFLVVGILFF